MLGAGVGKVRDQYVVAESCRLVPILSTSDCSLEGAVSAEVRLSHVAFLESWCRGRDYQIQE